jgi:hypothetical protein
MKRTRTSRNKSEGGSRRRKSMRRHTKKASKGMSDWNKKVMAIYKDMKSKNPNTKLGDAMKHASALKKKGQL